MKRLPSLFALLVFAACSSDDPGHRGSGECRPGDTRSDLLGTCCEGDPEREWDCYAEYECDDGQWRRSDSGCDCFCEDWGDTDGGWNEGPDAASDADPDGGADTGTDTGTDIPVEDTSRYASCSVDVRDEATGELSSHFCESSDGAPWSCDCDGVPVAGVESDECRAALTAACGVPEQADSCRVAGDVCVGEIAAGVPWSCRCSGASEWVESDTPICRDAAFLACAPSCGLDGVGACVPSTSRRWDCTCDDATAPTAQWGADCDDALGRACREGCELESGNCFVGVDGDSFECRCGGDSFAVDIPEDVLAGDTCEDVVSAYCAEPFDDYEPCARENAGRSAQGRCSIELATGAWVCTCASAGGSTAVSGAETGLTCEDLLDEHCPASER